MQSFWGGVILSEAKNLGIGFYWKIPRSFGRCDDLRMTTRMEPALYTNRRNTLEHFQIKCEQTLGAPSFVRLLHKGWESTTLSPTVNTLTENALVW